MAFHPTAAGDRNARLTIQDNASGNPHQIPLRGSGVDPNAPQKSVGPIDVRDGFPLWYEDQHGLRLGLCLDANGLCLAPLPDPTQPPSVTDSIINFPEETFWWSAEARITRAIGGKVLLVLALEAAFTGDPAVGEQISFGRVRVRIDRLRPGKTYKITHPYGVLNNLVADAKGVINVTEDIGSLTSPADFSLTLQKRRRSSDAQASCPLRYQGAAADVSQP